MSTKRVTIERHRKVQITDEAVELFKLHEATFPIYHACIHGACRIREEGKGWCPECRDFFDSSRKLNALLDIPLHGPDLIDVADTPEPPPGLDLMRAKAWPRVRQLRCELEAAARKHFAG